LDEGQKRCRDEARADKCNARPQFKVRPCLQASDAQDPDAYEQCVDGEKLVLLCAWISAPDKDSQGAESAGDEQQGDLRHFFELGLSAPPAAGKRTGSAS
jgi:hypothetical protein